ncbi:protein kinase [Candidatus Uabimicrobium sp. HlEnr_7]|uniref:serine/threonine-protein kinase n=1 Tax=Candidatus Uabimicrobium helgolandensis TaxID=3095367 RepID=UPI003559282C
MPNPKNTNNMKALLDIALSESFDCGAVDSKTQKISPATFDLKPGQKLNQYLIIEEIGRGGMGIVYKASDSHLKREVAIKVILSPNDKKHSEKLLKEAQSIAQLSHPNIIQVFEVHSSPIPFFVMEFIDGQSLDQFIKKRNKTIRGKEYSNTIVNIFISAAKALQFAHDKKIIHRDIKPENIMLDKHLKPKIMDFGLADIEWCDVSVTGELAGTPMYMSPEQAKSRKLTRSSDIYSLGASLYEALTTRAIFQGDTLFNIMFQIMHEEPVRLRLLNPEISKDLEAICLKCVEKKADKRYKAMELLGNDLKNYLEGKPVVAKPINSLRRIYRFAKRNKLLSSIIFVIPFIILVASAFYYYKEREIHQITEKKEIIVQQKQNEIADKEVIVQQKQNEIVEKEKLIKKQKQDIRQKSYFNLVNNLFLMKEHIYNGYLPTEDPFEKAEENYRDLGVNPSKNIEFRFLKKKYKIYSKVQEHAPRYIFTTPNRLIIVSSNTIVQRKIGSLKEEKIIILREKGYLLNVICAAQSNDKTLISIIAEYAGINYLIVYNIKNFKRIAIQELIQKPKEGYSSCFFYEKNTLISGRALSIGTSYIEGNKLKTNFKKIFPLNPFNKSINTITSITKDQKNGYVLFIYSGKMYSYNLKDKKAKPKIKAALTGHLITCYTYNPNTKTIFAGTARGKLFSIDETGHIDIFYDTHKSQVKKIAIYNNCIVTCNDKREIFIWNHDKQVERKIYLPENGIKDFIYLNNSIFCVADIYLYSFDLSVKNPVHLKKSFHSLNMACSQHSFSTFNLLHQTINYDFRDNKLNANMKLFKPHYFFKHPKKLGELTITTKLDLLYNGKTVDCDKSLMRGGVYDPIRDIHYLYGNKKEILIWSWKLKKITDIILYKEKSIYKNHINGATLGSNSRYLLLPFRFPEEFKTVLYIFDTKTGEQKTIKIKHKHPSANPKVQLVAHGGKTRLFLSTRNKIKVLDFDQLLLEKEISFALEHSKEITCFAVVQNGERIITIDHEKMMVWNIEPNFKFNRRLLLELATQGTINDCQYFPNHKKLVTIGENILIWDFK